MDKPDLIKTFGEIESRLACLDFDAIWPGFQAVDFALYRDETMCYRGELADRPPSFMGNTALDYQGRPVAIWDMAYTPIEGPDSLDRLAANLVHESFHAFQQQRGETRFPQDLDLLLYPQNAALVAWTRRDTALLAGSRDDPAKLLTSLAFVRDQKTRLSAGATANEYRAETAEGLAEYAGIKGLEQLNPRLAQARINQYRQFLRDDSYLFDIRRRCYFSGLLLALTVEEAGLTLVHDLASPAPLWDLLAVEATEGEPLSRREVEEACSLLNEEHKRKASLLADFQARFPRERPVQALIRGYDPMNMTRVGDYLICSHFLMTDESDPPVPLMGDSLIRMKAGDPQRIEAIYDRPS